MTRVCCGALAWHARSVEQQSFVRAGASLQFVFHHHPALLRGALVVVASPDPSVRLFTAAVEVCDRMCVCVEVEGVAPLWAWMQMQMRMWICRRMCWACGGTQYLVDLLAAAEVVPVSAVSNAEVFGGYNAVLDGVATLAHSLQRAVKDEDEDVRGERLGGWVAGWLGGWVAGWEEGVNFVFSSFAPYVTSLAPACHDARCGIHVGVLACGRWCRSYTSCVESSSVRSMRV